MRVNTICLPAGHYRVEEGSEHYLFYELEERLRRPFIHGWIVGLGVYLLSRLQEHRHAEAVAFMEAVGLRYQPADLQIRREDLAAALLNVRRYVEGRRDLWYTVINERAITPEWVDAKRDGGSHSPWTNARTGEVEAVPRHSEVSNRLAERICRGLSVPEVGRA